MTSHRRVSICHRRFIVTGAMLVAMALLSARPAFAQLRVVNYNIAQLNGNLNALQGVFEALNADDRPGFATPPHVYVFQEVQDEDVSVLLSRLNSAGAPFGVSYTQGRYTNSDEDGFAGAQAMFYRNDTLDEDVGAHADIFTGAGRFSDRWKLSLDAYTSPAAAFYIYSSHLKASTGFEQERLDGVESLRANADALGQGTHIIYCGDMNFYSHNESGYAEFLSAGNGQAIDPLGSGSWNGSGNAIKHSQSPRLTNGGGLAGGGVDDRFDFQLISGEMFDADGLSVIPGTYRSLGNDGNHFDLAINLGNNFYYPGEIARSNALADDLHEASDHIPVVADYQIPAVMSASMPTDFGRVIQNATAFIDALVENTASVLVPAGADDVSYDSVGSGGFSGLASGSAAPLGPPDIASFAIDTSSVGPLSGNVFIAASSQATENASAFLSASGAIVRPANASFDPAIDQDSRTVNESFDADTGVQLIDVDVHNLGYDANQALLDVDNVTGASSPYQFLGGLASNLGATPTTLTFAFDTTGLAPGTFDDNISVVTSDEDITGATTTVLALTLSVTVGDGGGCIADLANNDGIVSFDDLATLLAMWGPCPAPCAADVANADDFVDFDDLSILLSLWGPCP